MNKSKWMHARAGFSLIEMMVTILIFTMVVAGVYAVSISGESSWHTNKAQIELQQELRKAKDYMINELRQAGSSSIADVPSDGAWYPTITFKTPSGVTSGSLTWNIDDIQFVLGGTNSDQLRRVTPAETTVLAQNIQTLQFRRSNTDPNTLEISMLGSMNTEKGFLVQENLNFSIQLRN